MKNLFRNIFLVSCLLLTVGAVEAQAQGSQKGNATVKPYVQTQAEAKAAAEKAAKSKPQVVQTVQTVQTPKPYVPTQAEAKAAAEKAAKLQIKPQVVQAAQMKPYVLTEADKKAKADKLANPQAAQMKPYVLTEADKKAKADKLANPQAAQMKPIDLEADKKAKADKLAAEAVKQQQLAKEIALQTANKQLWISQHPAEYQAMLNQPGVQQTLTKAELNQMPAAKRDQILAHPEKYKIVD